MPDSSPQQPPGPTQAEASGNGDSPLDPLSKLHRMSRTAGLGTQDYVAINPAAVTALFLGLASALALVTGMLLIIPAAGVICAIVALWQISRSSGTQSGRWLAGTGLVLSLLFVAGVGATKIAFDIRDRADRESLMKTVEEFGAKLAAEDLDGAYDMLGDRFRRNLPKEEFDANIKARFAHPAHGKLVSMRSSGRIQFENYEQIRNAFGTTQTVIQLDNGREDRQQMGFQKLGDKWVIEGFGWFPPRPSLPVRNPNAPRQ
jgi:hypothetical protein